MKPTDAPPLLRLTAIAAALLFLAACGKKETAQAGPPPPPAPVSKTSPAGTPSEPASPATAGDVAAASTPAPVPPAPPPVALPSPAKIVQPPPAKPAASAVFVRAGPLARARRLADFVGTVRSGETSLKLTLHSGETWTIRQPVDDVDLPELPALANTPWVHVETRTGGTLVPFAAVQSITLAPISADKEKARAHLVLQDGTQLTGVVRGRLGGVSEFGGFEVPWRAIKDIELTGRENSAPAEALPLAGPGAALLADGTRLEFTAWATVAGDVISDVLLAESGTGPEIVALANIGAVEIAGSDPNAFFYQHSVSLAERGQGATTRRNAALAFVLLQQANGCVVFVAPAALQNISRP